MNTVRNVSVSIGTQLVLTILSFVSRTVFVTSLGAELLGLNALFISVVSVISLADLGLNTALMYAMYRPLSAGDERTIRGLLGLSAKLYRFVALAVACIGLAFMPLVHLLVHTEQPVPHLQLYFAGFIVNESLRYLMAYRAILIIADQRLSATKIITGIFAASGTIAQIAVLVAFESYLLYVLALVISGILGNVAVFIYVGRQYPYVKGRAPLLPKAERKEIFGSIRASLIYRVGGVVLNNTDPVIISLLIGTVALGYYSNYFLVVAAASMFTDLVLASVAASVGSLNATNEASQKVRIFDEIHLMSFLLYGSISVGFLVLLPDLIDVWLGSIYVLDTSVLVGVVLNFYLYGVTSAVMTFRTATGIFRETQYVFLVTALLNIVLSLLLAREFGLAGILFATAISRLLTNFWFEPVVLFRRILNSGVRPYFFRQLTFLLILVFAYLASTAAVLSVPMAGLPGLAIRSILTLATTLLIFWLAFRKNASFLSVRRRFPTLIRRA